jgi:hypothetical protein
MLAFVDSTAGEGGIAPERVDQLVGEPSTWGFPTMVCLVAGGVIAVVAAVAVLAGQLAVGSATLAPPFVSRQPCIVVLALIAALVGLVCVRSAAGAWQRSRTRAWEETEK